MIYTLLTSRTNGKPHRPKACNSAATHFIDSHWWSFVLFSCNRQETNTQDPLAMASTLSQVLAMLKRGFKGSAKLARWRFDFGDTFREICTARTMPSWCWNRMQTMWNSQRNSSHFQGPFQDSGKSSGICAKRLGEGRYRSFAGKSFLLCLLELRVSSMRVTIPCFLLDEIGCETGEITAKEIGEKSGAKLNCHRFLATGETELWRSWVNQSTFYTSRIRAHRSTWRTVLQLVVQRCCVTKDSEVYKWFVTPNSEPCSSLRSLIDQHYGCVAMKAVKTDPHDLVVPDDALKSFEDHFEFVEFLIFADFLFNVSNTLMSFTSIESFFLTTEVTTVSPWSFQPFRLSLTGLLWHLLGACIEEGCSSCASSSFSCVIWVTQACFLCDMSGNRWEIWQFLIPLSFFCLFGVCCSLFPSFLCNFQWLAWLWEASNSRAFCQAGLDLQCQTGNEKAQVGTSVDSWTWVDKRNGAHWWSCKVRLEYRRAWSSLGWVETRLDGRFFFVWSTWA